ncbi:MAG TPA: outer membrane lipoprotein-sorting protein [Nevskiaceae bacterium]|nr:outer membrane lipoprotein-sorting protein [Nevskiaceae bacterium]
MGETMERIRWGVSLLLLATQAWADADVDRVIACMRANLPVTTLVEQVELSTSDRSGTRVLRGSLYVKGERTPAGARLRAMLRLDAPPDLAGAAYLLRQSADLASDEVYFYLPAIRRARRVTGASADAPLLGSGFSYNDFRQMQTAFVDGSALMEDPEMIDAHPAWVLSFRPPPDEEGHAPYTLVRSWVDQRACVPLKTEFSYGVDIVKQLSASVASLRQFGSTWYAGEVQLRDLHGGGSSTLKVLSASGGAIADAVFDPAIFFSAR